MRKALTFFILITVAALLSGCIVSKTPNTNDITIPVGEQVTFNVVVFPPTATFAWTLDGAPLSNTGNSYVYTAQEGGHFLIVRATHVFGTDTQAWYINSPVITTFNKTYGGSGNEWATAVQQTSDGCYILVGETGSFGAGGYDFWLIKTDAGGNKSWDKTFGESDDDFAYAMQQTSDGGYILAGWTNSYGAGGVDAWLIKTDANGNKVWDNTFGGGSYDLAEAVQQTTDGGYILAGETSSFGAGANDAWLIKTEAKGNKVWDKTFGGSNQEQANAVQQTSDGGYILAGRASSFWSVNPDVWLIKSDANGNKVWDKTFGGSSYDEACAVQQTSDGGYILAGYTRSFGAGKSAAWLIKTDANGNKVWDKTYGGSNQEQAYAVQQTSDGGYILAGRTASFGAGFYDAWLIKTDADGNKVWDKTFGGSSWDEGLAVQQTSDGGYILAGPTNSFGAGSMDAWLIKTDADGNKVWDKIFGGSGDDVARAVQQTSDGGYILAGYTGSFGAGVYDAWLIKTDAEGNAPAKPTP